MMKMGIDPTVLIFFYVQLCCNPLFAVIKGSSLPATIQTPTTERIDPTTQPFRYSSPTSERRDPVKNGLPMSTASPTVTAMPESKFQNGHIIGAVLIGVILIAMIVVIVGIFLWKRMRRTGSVDPHWAGRSPFADGDVLEITGDKEPVQSSKRASVLSLLPWKFNKDTLLLENAEQQPSEAGHGLDDPNADGAERRDSQSSPTATENSVSSSTSQQTGISDGPGSLTDIPLQPDNLLPEPVDLPPPPSWTGEISTDLCPNGNGSLPLQSPVETLCSVPPNSTGELPGEALLLPPPPEGFFSAQSP